MSCSRPFVCDRVACYFRTGANTALDKLRGRFLVDLLAAPGGLCGCRPEASKKAFERFISRTPITLSRVGGRSSALQLVEEIEVLAHAGAVVQVQESRDMQLMQCSPAGDRAKGKRGSTWFRLDRDRAFDMRGEA